jgi:hypothetical protein
MKVVVAFEELRAVLCNLRERGSIDRIETALIGDFLEFVATTKIGFHGFGFHFHFDRSTEEVRREEIPSHGFLLRFVFRAVPSHRFFLLRPRLIEGGVQILGRERLSTPASLVPTFQHLVDRAAYVKRR